MPENMSDRMPGMVPDKLSDIVMARVGFNVLNIFWSGVHDLLQELFGRPEMFVLAWRSVEEVNGVMEVMPK